MEIPKLEPSLFRWHSFSADSKAVQRLANGTEAWVGIRDENAKGQYDNYLNTTLRVGATMSLSLAKLQEALSMALVHVRFEHPDLACTAIWGQGKNPNLPHIKYEPPASNAEALEWAKGCVTTHTSNYGGLELRLKLSQQRRAKAVAQSAPSVSIILIANTADDQAALNEGDTVEMLMLFNHIFWDAMGSREFVGQLQKHLGKILESRGNYKLPEFQWGDEISNLDLPILDACKVNVEALGTDFEAVRADFIDGLMRSG
ncbi:trichothecene 15-O-acetyltransferase [Penicillium malachiteum]|uniref:trichothecene 15-O-acetyltransferase n=1 Tax=Penicillium malachiteum TaxID=1324776 RepID=UPI0025480D81|nr:trichothecene 15-O-acetyltransferase [Penicillium malachiteum]KAJ5713558.1 trichothecene 15-O-acetyltransferase [Penicillium malachiteum]